MVIPEQMKGPVNQQRGQLMIQGMAVTLSLTDCLRQGNDHVAQQFRRGARGTGRETKEGFPHRKGQHIGGVISTTVEPVQPPHPAITDERKTDERPLLTDLGQNSLSDFSQRRLSHPVTTQMIPYEHSHWVWCASRLAPRTSRPRVSAGISAAGPPGPRRHDQRIWVGATDEAPGRRAGENGARLWRSLADPAHAGRRP